jgi:hypothetical protein
MEQEQKTAIYDRLLAIKILIDPDPIPKPSYIGEKLWECHRYIEETEQYSILVTREMSVYQTALNNAEAACVSKRDHHLSTNVDIQNLPAIKDREARTNNLLKEDLTLIKEYKNEMSSLGHLSKAIDLKLKNLNRLNQDIRLQVRVLEAQVKLNNLPKSDPVTMSLVEEMAKSRLNTDAFMDPESSVEPTNVVDPTMSLNVDILLTNEEESTLVNPVPDLNPEENGVVPEDVKSEETLEEKVEEETKVEVDVTEFDWVEKDAQAEVPEDTVVNLDDILEIPQTPVVKEEPAAAIEEANPAVKEDSILDILVEEPKISPVLETKGEEKPTKLESQEREAGEKNTDKKSTSEFNIDDFLDSEFLSSIT